MKCLLMVALLALTGCGTSKQEIERPKKVAACRNFDNSVMDVGISDYQTCVGKLANRTRPANRELCNEANGTITTDGSCRLPE